MSKLPPPSKVFQEPAQLRSLQLYTAVYALCDNSPEPLWPRVICATMLNPIGPYPYIFDEVDSAIPGSNDFVDKINQIGKMYVNHFIRPFKEHGGRTPEPSYHPSRPSFNRGVENSASQLTPGQRSYAKAKEAAMARERNRCIVTRLLDTKCEPEEPEEFQIDTNCCHIIPRSLSSWNLDKDTHSKTRTTATFWTIVSKFGYTSMQSELAGEAFHQLHNIFIMHSMLHQWMDRMELWFEAVDGSPHTYKVVTRKKNKTTRTGHHVPDTITFTTPNPKYALPNPEYLRIHAAACRIAELSGAAEYIETYFRDMEDIGVLAHDGGSAAVLRFALEPYQLIRPAEAYRLVGTVSS